MKEYRKRTGPIKAWAKVMYFNGAISSGTSLGKSELCYSHCLKLLLERWTSWWLWVLRHYWLRSDVKQIKQRDKTKHFDFYFLFIHFCQWTSAPDASACTFIVCENSTWIKMLRILNLLKSFTLMCNYRASYSHSVLTV